VGKPVSQHHVFIDFGQAMLTPLAPFFLLPQSGDCHFIGLQPSVTKYKPVVFVVPDARFEAVL
jgi:hypothetical protein